MQIQALQREINEHKTQLDASAQEVLRKGDEIKSAQEALDKARAEIAQLGAKSPTAQHSSDEVPFCVLLLIVQLLMLADQASQRERAVAAGAEHRAEPVGWPGQGPGAAEEQRGGQGQDDRRPARQPRRQIQTMRRTRGGEGLPLFAVLCAANLSFRVFSQRQYEEAKKLAVDDYVKKYGQAPPISPVSLPSPPSAKSPSSPSPSSPSGPLPPLPPKVKDAYKNMPPAPKAAAKKKAAKKHYS